jgi:two-component system, LytTR family, response regulator
MIKAIIVDDEAPQQELLAKRLYENFPDISLEAICSSIDEGVEKIELLKPQLVFLDVQMPPDTGFDLLKRLKEINFEVIFTTSFSEYAVDAFKVSAVYYLLKPYSVSDLQEAIGKFKSKMALKQPYENIQTLLHNINVNTIEKTKIALATLTGLVIVEVGEIIRCESEGQYTQFHLTNKNKTLISKSLGECEELLLKFNFCRIHLSHMINMQYVKEYVKGDGGQVKMSDGSCLEVSRRKRDEFLKLLHKL